MDIKSQAQEILKNVAAAKKMIAQIEGAVKRLAEGKAAEVNTKLMAATLDKGPAWRMISRWDAASVPSSRLPVTRMWSILQLSGNSSACCNFASNDALTVSSH